MSEMKPILLLDFDGVCHSYVSGWMGADVISDPHVPGLFEFLERAKGKFDIQIYSSRSGQEGGISAMLTWFIQERRNWRAKGNKPPLDTPLDLSFPTDKPAAFVTIDDRAIQFTGQWPAVETLVDFKPWNKRPAAPAAAEPRSDAAELQAAEPSLENYIAWRTMKKDVPMPPQSMIDDDKLYREIADELTVDGYVYPDSESVERIMRIFKSREIEARREISAWHAWFFHCKRLYMNGNPKEFENLFLAGSPYGREKPIAETVPQSEPDPDGPCVTNLSQQDYQNLIRDAMRWRHYAENKDSNLRIETKAFRDGYRALGILIREEMDRPDHLMRHTHNLDVLEENRWMYCWRCKIEKVLDNQITNYNAHIANFRAAAPSPAEPRKASDCAGIHLCHFCLNTFVEPDVAPAETSQASAGARDKERLDWLSRQQIQLNVRFSEGTDTFTFRTDKAHNSLRAQLDKHMHMDKRATLARAALAGPGDAKEPK